MTIVDPFRKDACHSVKAGTHWPNHWPSEAFGETRTSSGTNLCGVFSCVGSFWSHAPIQRAKSEMVGCRRIGRHWILFFHLAMSSYKTLHCDHQLSQNDLSRNEAEAVCFSATFLPNGMRGSGVVR